MKRIFLLILLGIYLGLYADAQNSSFYNSFVDDQSKFDPELLMFEPHYNADGTISHYSIANILKIEYERNEKGQPIRKTMSAFDRYDYDWDNLFITDYEYKNGRLIREVLIPKKGTGSNTAMIDKRISYDPATNTDTVRIEDNTALMYSAFPRDENEESYTVRYYNRENTKIDSVLQVFIYSYNSYDSLDSLYTEKSIVEQKVIYEYDKSGRIKGAKSNRRFCESEEKPFSEWEEIYSFDVNHKKNETEYVQRSTYFYRDEDDYLSEYKKRKDVTRFRIATDDKGRITQKHMIIDNEIVLNVDYSYDNQGRLSVSHEQNMTDRFLEMFGAMGFGKDIMRQLGDKMNYLKYTLKQVDNCEDIAVHLKDDNKIKLVGEFKFCKSDDGCLSEVERKQYDEGELDDYEKMVFNYKEDGSVEKTEYNYVYDETDTKQLVLDKKVIVKKDNNERIIYEEVARFDDETKKWENDSKEIYEYNEEGLVTHEETYRHGSSNSYFPYSPNESFKGDGWIGQNWEERKYDENQNVIDYQKKYWDGGKWINHSWSKYSYDESNNKNCIEAYRWDKDENEWRGSERDSTVYNSDGKEICKIYYKWLPEQKEWQFENKIESDRIEIERDKLDPYSYSELKKVESKWENDQWIPVLRIENKLGDYKRSEFKWKWDENKKEWYQTYRSISEKEEDYSYEEYARWSDDCNCLEGRENTTTIYLDKEQDNKRFIHRVWDYNISAWKDTISIFELHDYDRSKMTKIYELYDEGSKSWEFSRKVVSSLIENEAGLREMTSVLSLWDNKQKMWNFDTKTIYSYIKNKEEDGIVEIQDYDTASESWENIYRFENIKIKKKRGTVTVTLYSSWNKDKNVWDPIYAEDEKSWDPYYKWDATKQKLVPTEYAQIEEIEDKINKANNKVNTDTKYSDLIDRW